ncbi:MAG: hemerythrin domain-containing protein [Pseudonocardiaceae bacterium]
MLGDHRKFEDLMRGLRDVTADRASLRAELSAVLIAHAVAGERAVYPKLRKKASDSDEVEHGQEEHAEINHALLDFLEIAELEGESFSGKLEDLVAVVNHHTNEEELTLLNDARLELSDAERGRRGEAFLTERKVLLDSDCGRLENVRSVVGKTRWSGRRSIVSTESQVDLTVCASSASSSGGALRCRIVQ